MLPEHALLEIFEFYRKNFNNARLWKWHLLAHVCRKWRQIVFSSPLRLHLRILCTSRTSVEKNLSIWPTFPINIEYTYSGSDIRPRGADNVIAALKHRDRVCDISLDTNGLQLGHMVTMMMEPFPVLTHLHIRSDDSNVPVLPKEFLGRSAPRLREITVYGIPCPALPALLPSATNLVILELRRVPMTGYISPQAMATCLAALPRLDTFDLQFQSAIPRPERMHPPVTRILLPALTSFGFKGASEYLEDLVPQIDSPRLDQISIVYLNQLVDFQVAQLSKFIERSVIKGTPFKRAQITFSGDSVSFDMYHDEIHTTSCRHATRIAISCREIDWQVSLIAQVLRQISATLSNIVRLTFESPDQRYPRLDGADNAEWLPLLHQFSAVRALHASGKLAKHVSQTLEDIPQDMFAGVLPFLNLIDLEGQLASSVEKFITARRLSGHPVTVVDFKRERAREEARVKEKARVRMILEKARVMAREKARKNEEEEGQENSMREKAREGDSVIEKAWEREWEWEMKWDREKREKRREREKEWEKKCEREWERKWERERER